MRNILVLYWKQTAFIGIKNEAILREIEHLAGSITVGHYLSNMRCADDKSLMADTERKLHELFLAKVVKESEKKGLNINCKKTEYTVVNKTNRLWYKLRIEDTKLKQVENYRRTVLTENRKCDSEIGKWIIKSL